MRLRLPIAAGLVAALGSFVLAACIYTALTGVSSRDRSKTSADACNDLVLKSGGATVDDRLGKLRIVAVDPATVRRRDYVCIIVAGVTSEAEATAADEMLAARKKAYETAIANLNSASGAAITQARTIAAEAEKSYRAAVDEASLPVIGLTLYLNSAKVPLQIQLEANPYPDPQALYFRLSLSADARGEGAAFWRGLASGVSDQKLWGDKDQLWGRVEVLVGLSRATQSGSTPETYARGGDAPKVQIDIYSFWPLAFGGVTLVLFSLALILYAMGTTLLRDNDLKLGDLPSRIKAARAELDQVRLVRDSADLALLVSKETRGDSAKVVAAATAQAAFDTAAANLDSLERAMNLIGKHRTAYSKREKEASTLKDDYRQKANDIDLAMMTMSGSAAKFRDMVTREASDARNRQANAQPDFAGIAQAEAQALGSLEATAASLVAQVAAFSAADKALRTNRLMLWSRNDAKAALTELITEAEAAVVALDKTKLLKVTGSVNQSQLEDELEKLTKAKVAADAAVQSTNLELAETALSDTQAQVPQELASIPIGSFSLSMSQMAFWFVLVAAAYIFIAMSIGQPFGLLNQNVVALLGVSGLTTVGAAIVATDNKTQISRGFLRDIVSANEAPQLQRLQAVAWTLILGAVFVWVVFADFKLPEFDSDTLLLMGIVNGIYVGLKLKEGDKGAPAATSSH